MKAYMTSLGLYIIGDRHSRRNNSNFAQILPEVKKRRKSLNSFYEVTIKQNLMGTTS